MDAKPRLDISHEVAEIRGKYKSRPSRRKLHGLILGEKGVGKTTLAKTCPKPALIFSFDPGGTEVLEDEINRGDIVVYDFEDDSLESPHAYIESRRTFKRLKEGGFFSAVATTVVDSLTTLASTLVWQIMKKEGRTSPGLNMPLNKEKHGMRIQDYQTLLDMFIMLARDFSQLPCHTIFTGHISRDKEEATQKWVRGVMLPGQAKGQFPVYLHEVYVLQVRETVNGLAHQLLTQNDGEYRATTRMGRDGRFEKYEKPDIRALLKKAGYPHEDLPPLPKGD